MNVEKFDTLFDTEEVKVVRHLHYAEGKRDEGRILVFTPSHSFPFRR